MSADDLQQRLGVRFKDLSLLEQALTHRSYLNENPETDVPDYERLEFLGDAVLDFITAEMLFGRFPEMDEGELTRLRSALVRTESLAELAQAIDLGPHIRMGKGEIRNGGRERVSTLCRAFEAMIGALYTDQGIEAVRTLVIPRLTTLQSRVLNEAINKDARTRLQEWTQSEFDTAPDYTVLKISGPDHDRRYLVEASLVGQSLANGVGKTIRAASKEAAANALRRIDLGEIDLPPTGSID
jgi:ribonuclease-3